MIPRFSRGCAVIRAIRRGCAPRLAAPAPRRACASPMRPVSRRMVQGARFRVQAAELVNRIKGIRCSILARGSGGDEAMASALFRKNNHVKLQTR